MSAMVEPRPPRPPLPEGVFGVRKPTDPELAAEGWARWGEGDAEDEWRWFHEKSRRSVEIKRGLNANVGQWEVYVQLWDEEGNPAHLLHTLLSCSGMCAECRAAWEALGPFARLADAMRVARGIRRSIVAESPPRPFVEQLGLFGAEAPDAPEPT